LNKKLDFPFFVCYASRHGSQTTVFRSRLASNSGARTTIHQASGANNRCASKQSQRAGKARRIKILKIPVNHHHLTAHLINQRKTEKRASVKEELKKATKVINKNY